MNYEQTDAGFLRPKHDRVNVILIMCDQLPYYALGCYGHPLVKTPNLDALAARGVLCTNAYSQSPICCPARASQLSGLYPSNHGILENNANLEIMNPNVRFLTDRVYREGYATAHFGKWHCLRKLSDCKFTESKFLEESIPVWMQSDIKELYGRCGGPVFIDFDGWIVHAATHPCSQDNTGPARITDWSIDFMERFAYRPFFMRVSYLGPHAPVLVPKPFDTMYDIKDITLCDFPHSDFENRAEVNRKMQQRCIERRKKCPPGISPEQAIKYHVAYSLGLITHIDDQIGRLMRRLDDLGLRDNTVIVFTTDHGGFWGEYGLLEKGGYCLYRNLMQTPLIVSYPGVIPEGSTCDGFVESVDIVPTLMDFAGIEDTHRINGISLKNALVNGAETGREDVFAELVSFHHGHSAISLRDSKWNFIWLAKTGESELYDMENDPQERFNLAHDEKYKRVCVEMRLRLLDRIMNGRNVDMIPDDEDISRSPIYLTPNWNFREDEENLIRMFRGTKGIEPTRRSQHW